MLVRALLPLAVVALTIAALGACSGSDFAGSGSKAEGGSGSKKSTSNTDDGGSGSSGSGSGGSSGSGSSGSSGTGSSASSGSGSGSGSSAKTIPVGSTVAAGDVGADGAKSGVSTNEEVARFDPKTGAIIGVSEGTATVTLTLENGEKRDVVITVTDANGGIGSDIDLANKPVNVEIVDGAIETSCEEGVPGGIIDFETLPDGGATTDDMEISDQYAEAYGLTFELEGGGHPVIAKVGAPLTAFQCDQLAGTTCVVEDGLIAGAAVKFGKSFLTDGKDILKPLIVRYKLPTFKASGYILDLDGNEDWTIDGLDSADEVLVTAKLVANGNSLNGSGALWTLEAPAGKKISAVRLSGVKPNSPGLGLAFDRFSPGKICE